MGNENICRLNWIKVEERLPDDDETVLVYAPKASDPVWPGFHGTFFDNEEPRWYYADNMPADDVTHWAPMPTGPQ